MCSFVNNKFEFLDSNGNPLVGIGTSVAGAGLAPVALAAGQVVSIGGLGALSATGYALAALSAPVVVGAAAGALTIGAILTLRNLFGKIKYQDYGVNRHYVNVKFKENLPPVLYSEFRADQEIAPAATVSMAAPPFSRSLGGPLSASLTPNPIHYGTAGNPWLTLSPSMQEALGSIQSFTNHEPLGFKDFIEPFKIRVGDQIKFEGNENKVHTVVQIVPQNASLPPTLRGSAYTMYKVEPPVEGKTWVKNFQVRRFIQDPTSILLKGNDDQAAPNKLYFTSSSLKGTITPEFMSPTLEENFADYKQQLIAKGIIS